MADVRTKTFKLSDGTEIVLRCNQQGATPGRVVHYIPCIEAGNAAMTPWVAIIVEVHHDGTCDLELLGGEFQNDAEKMAFGVPHSAEYRREHWSWPPRFED